MMDMIRGAVSEPYTPDGNGGTLPVCCDVEVTVRVINAKGFETLLELLRAAQDISTRVEVPF